MATKTKRKPYKKPRPGALPIVFGLSKNDTEELSKLYRDAFEECKQGKMTVSIWYDLGVRIAYSIVIAKKFYSDENYVELQRVFTAIETIRDRFIKDDVWAATPQELDDILTGLEAADEIQKQVVRREQLIATKKAVLLMNEVVRHVNVTVIYP